MSVLIEVSIGTHTIRLWPNGESLRAELTWHDWATIHNWTLASLQWAANAAENDDDYIAAEAEFIRLMTGKKPRLRRS